MAYSKADIFSPDEVQIAQIAKALSHPARVAILIFLSKKKSCICGDIVEELPLSQSTVSQHLKEMKKAGLIDGEIDGPRVCYCLNLQVCQKAMKIFNQLFNEIKCC